MPRSIQAPSKTSTRAQRNVKRKPQVGEHPRTGLQGILHLVTGGVGLQVERNTRRRQGGEGKGFVSTSLASRSRSRTHRPNTRGTAQEAQAQSKRRASPATRSVNHSGSSRLGVATLRPRDGPSLQFAAEYTCSPPGHKPAPNTYGSVDLSTRERAGLEERPFAAEPNKTRESISASRRQAE